MDRRLKGFAVSKEKRTLVISRGPASKSPAPNEYNPSFQAESTYPLLSRGPTFSRELRFQHIFELGEQPHLRSPGLTGSIPSEDLVRRRPSTAAAAMVRADNPYLLNERYHGALGVLPGGTIRRANPHGVDKSPGPAAYVAKKPSAHVPCARITGRHKNPPW
jgi:hypothetical protein